MTTPSQSVRALQRIPLRFRQAFYCVGFYALALVALPYALTRLDARLPFGPIVLPWIVRAAGWILLAAIGVAYLLCSYWLMSRGRGAYVEFDPPREFVATGPFRWCRNPIAACVVAMIFAEAIAFSSLTLFLVFLLAIPLAQLQVVALEEPLLRKRFGAAYEDYLARVPRWLPRRPR